MSLPRILKNMNLYHNGVSYLGEVPEVALPKLALQLEDYRAGGMLGNAKVNLGVEAMEMEIKGGGAIVKPYASFGGPINADTFLWMGAYEADDTGLVTAVEITTRGRFSEIDPGSAKPGDKTEESYKQALTYYKRTENGVPIVEIDMLNMKFITGGVDRYAEIRNAMGL